MLYIATVICIVYPSDIINIIYRTTNFNFGRWTWAGNVQNDANQERRRHSAVLRELERTQRSNSSHFVLLCLVPTSLLLIVTVSVVGDIDECAGSLNNDPYKVCANEPKTFVNVFTTRCVCEAVTVIASST